MPSLAIEMEIYRYFEKETRHVRTRKCVQVISGIGLDQRSPQTGPAPLICTREVCLSKSQATKELDILLKRDLHSETSLPVFFPEKNIYLSLCGQNLGLSRNDPRQIFFIISFIQNDNI